MTGPGSSSQVNLAEIIDKVDYGINVVDRDYNILYLNMASRKKWNIVDFTPSGLKCHKLLFGNDSACENCPIIQMEQTGEQLGQIVGALNTPDHPNHRVKYHKLAENRYAQTLTDVTRETELVRKVTLQSKETQAQNIILKRKRQQYEEHSAFLNSVFDSILSGFLVIDSSTELNIMNTNKAMTEFIKLDSKENLEQKCFQLFGYQRRCPGCPIERITGRTDFSKLRYHQKVSDRTLTEYYTRLPEGEGLLLTFEDSTKRVQLVQQVKEDKEIIERQNQIFRSLLATGTLIQQTDELDEMFTTTLNELQNLFFGMGFGIILNGDRPNIIESAVFLGVEAEEQLTVVENNLLLFDANISDVLITQIKERYGKIPGETQTPTQTHWSVLPVKGRDRIIIGKLLIKGTELEEQSLEIISIFLEQVAAVAENKLLTKKLEKMANTDPLTQVFNRGYFNRELEKAVLNANRFSIAFSMLLIDVNGLKRVNDVFGHQAGDSMIISVAMLLKEACRKTDVITRLGGDEFVVLCPSTKKTQVKTLLARIREYEAGCAMDCTHEDGNVEKVNIRMSIGVGCSDEVDADEVLKQADAAMYADKEAFYLNNQRYR
ncbi:GGDEF domain-containing protein [Deltaproteobacteria bacterium TL4]